MKTTVYQVSGHPTGQLKNYLIGYFVSILFTLSAFFIVTNHVLTLNTTEYVIAMLAVAQFIVQIVYFLHLFNERNPRYRLLVFSLMLSIVIILITGSLWIMSNLNHNMTTIPKQIQYMNNQGGGF